LPEPGKEKRKEVRHSNGSKGLPHFSSTTIPFPLSRSGRRKRKGDLQLVLAMVKKISRKLEVAAKVEGEKSGGKKKKNLL